MIEKLNQTHAGMVKRLLSHPKYFGIVVNHQIIISRGTDHLTNFHAYGDVVNGELIAFMTFCESYTEPSWYCMHYLDITEDGGSSVAILNAAIGHNESRGRLKFYSCRATEDQLLLLPDTAWDQTNFNRYEHVDEFIVHAKTRCIFDNQYLLMHNNQLQPFDSINMCHFLKQEYRTTLFKFGNI